MRKLLFCALVFAACGLPASNQNTTAPTLGDSVGIPKINLGTIDSLDSETNMIVQGAAYANQVLASDCFKAEVLASNFTENNGLTAQQIWDLLSSNEVTVNVEMYSGSWWEDHITFTYGYENTGDPHTVHSNRYFIHTAYMVGDNLMHEGEGHSQGFQHLGVKSTSEPYGMNQIYEYCVPLLGIPQN